MTARRLLAIAAIVALLLAAAAPALGADETATRADLQGLIDATEAGGVLVLEPVVYAGGVVITAPLEIRGVPGTIVDAGGEGTAIEVLADDVTVTGLTVRNTGKSLDRENAGISVNGHRATITDNVLEDVLFGIFVRGSDDSLVAGNVIGAKAVDIARRGDGIRLWESHGTTVADNVVADGRDVVLWFSDDLVIDGNEVTDGRYGLHFMYSDRAHVEGNRLDGNSVGAFLMYSRDLTLIDNVLTDSQGPSGYGLGLKDMDGVTAEGNRFTGNRVGIDLDNSPWSTDVYQHFTGNLFAYNEIGVDFQPSVQRNVFSENAFIDNAEQVGIKGGGSLTGNDWSVEGRGNYWSDFAGYDADGDGVGDISYRLEELYSSLTDDHPELRFFGETPAAKALTMAGEMFPVLRPQPKVEDPHPLVDVPEFSSVSSGGGSSSGLAMASLAMLAVAAVVIAFSRPVGRRKEVPA
jgi:nitrous oxidase accessory protein